MRLTKTALVLLIAVLLLSACKPVTPNPSYLIPSPSALPASLLPATGYYKPPRR